MSLEHLLRNIYSNVPYIKTQARMQLINAAQKDTEKLMYIVSQVSLFTFISETTSLRTYYR